LKIRNELSLNDHVDEAFSFSCKEGNADLVNWFLEKKKVNPAALNNLAIRLAVEKGHAAIVEILLKDPRVDPGAIDEEVRQAKRRRLGI